MNEFDLLGPLPTGTTVLEASAGTGKTFTIAGLVARYVAEGVVRLDELLVVTFGRAATQELRDRVRERLVSARDGLADPATARAGDDALLRRLATGAPDEVAARHGRLVVALSSFDAATVATTHGFCQQMLIGLGTAADVDEGAVLVENLDDVVEEVVGDLYLRKWGLPDSEPPELTYAEALALARAVIGDPQAVLAPEQADGVAGTRLSFARRVREEVDRRKRARRVLGFDDLLTRLRDTLRSPTTGAAAAARLRGHYAVVLVDEFQDTDPVQWDILRSAFHGHATLVLIGDPKQAIYAFRGADVHAYLGAASVADRRATLARNWRSDENLLQGLDVVFRGATLGDPRIAVTPVRAAYEGRALAGAGPATRLRVVDSDALSVAEARRIVTRDVVAEIVALLEHGALLRPRDGTPERPVRPGDLAVIVRTRAQLDQVHTALIAAGVPSVQRTTSSVFRTPAAHDWVVLLEALEQPHRPQRVRRLAVSAFLGWDAAQLTDPRVDQLAVDLRRWLHAYEERGIAALFETLGRDTRLVARLLGQRDGERLLTDLRHVAEALHAAALANQHGLTATLEWLRHRSDEAGEDASTERSRRLDSDDAAVQVVTVHMSKGLEFPVVYVPFGWDRFVQKADIPLFHEDSSMRRVRNVGGPASPGFAADQSRAYAEEYGEDLRLLYVALTRAQARVTLWWAPTAKNTSNSPLHRLLFAPDPAVDVPQRIPVPKPARAVATLTARAVPDVLSVAVVPEGPDASWTRPARSTAELAVATLGRGLDTSWRRTSYSALTAGAHEAGPQIASEPEEPEQDDEPATPTAERASGGGIVSPMSDLPGGAAFGTLVHAVLEAYDPATADLTSIAAQQLARFGPAGLGAAVLAEALEPSLRTALGPAAGGRALREIATADRLAELDFELPLRGGDRPNGTSTLRELADVWRAHVPATDPLAGYAELLDDPVLGDQPLRGYLTGSIDVVLRVEGRYVVVDYKTNRLGRPDRPLLAGDYGCAALAETMLLAHYPLQALLYEVALHRFLRWRLPAYDPVEHLGGALYLFLRGMCGPDVVLEDGSVPGVFTWQPAAALVVATSDLLARGVS